MCAFGIAGGAGLGRLARGDFCRATVYDQDSVGLERRRPSSIRRGGSDYRRHLSFAFVCGRLITDSAQVIGAIHHRAGIAGAICKGEACADDLGSGLDCDGWPLTSKAFGVERWFRGNNCIDSSRAWVPHASGMGTARCHMALVAAPRRDQFSRFVRTRDTGAAGDGCGIDRIGTGLYQRLPRRARSGSARRSARPGDGTHHVSSNTNERAMVSRSWAHFRNAAGRDAGSIGCGGLGL